MTAFIIFASRTFIFSRNLSRILHGMVRRCTGCYFLECRGAAIALPVTEQYSLQRFMLLIWECPEERVSLTSGNCDIAERRARHNCDAIPGLLEQDRIYLPR